MLWRFAMTEPELERRSAGDRYGPAAILALCYAYFLVGQWQLHKRVMDDGFILFRLARNMAEGHGAVWNPGGERTEGWTSFLHPVVVAAISSFGVTPLRAPHLLNRGPSHGRRRPYSGRGRRSATPPQLQPSSS